MCLPTGAAKDLSLGALHEKAWSTPSGWHGDDMEILSKDTENAVHLTQARVAPAATEANP